MPRYYCDYCDTYLTHDSPSVRKQHNAGYKHKANVRTYYQQFEEQQTQSIIDEKIKMHLGQAAAMQVGASFSQHLLTLPGGLVRPRLPILPPPLGMGAPPSNMTLPYRPPVLPLPLGAPGYPGAPGVPTGTSMPMQMASLPRPPTLAPPTSGTQGLMGPNNSAPLANPGMYQTNPPVSAANPGMFQPNPSASAANPAMYQANPPASNYDVFGASNTSAPQGSSSAGAPATAT